TGSAYADHTLERTRVAKNTPEVPASSGTFGAPGGPPSDTPHSAFSGYAQGNPSRERLKAVSLPAARDALPKERAITGPGPRLYPHRTAEPEGALPRAQARRLRADRRGQSAGGGRRPMSRR